MIAIDKSKQIVSQHKASNNLLISRNILISADVHAYSFLFYEQLEGPNKTKEVEKENSYFHYRKNIFNNWTLFKTTSSENDLKIVHLHETFF